MAIADSNAIIKQYLDTCASLTALVSTRIVAPRLPEDMELPAVSFFTRGGGGTPYVPPIVEPSVQFDCWADNPIEARQVYRALYDNLQGIQNVTVGSYSILSAIEEVAGYDLVDVDIPGYFRCVTFFSIMIRVE